MLVRYNRLNIFTVPEFFRLTPGNNDVPTEKWEPALKLHPHLRHLIDIGVVETFTKSGAVREEPLAEDPNASGEDAKSEPPLEVEDISRLSEKKAIRIVKDTYEFGILTAWHASEKRAAVVKAIEGQFDAIAKAGEPEKEGK